MSRGRQNYYDRKRFIDWVLSRMAANQISMAELSRRAQVGKDMLSRVLRGLRPCPPIARLKILEVLNATTDERARFGTPFAPIPGNEAPTPYPVRLRGLLGERHDMGTSFDPSSRAHRLLRWGQDLLSRGLYEEAEDEFIRMSEAGEIEHNRLLQADASSLEAWLACELGQFDLSFDWAQDSIDVLQTHLGIDSIEAAMFGSSPNFSLPSGATACLLMRALYIRARSSIERVVYEGDWAGVGDARADYFSASSFNHYAFASSSVACRAATAGYFIASSFNHHSDRESGWTPLKSSVHLRRNWHLLMAIDDDSRDMFRYKPDRAFAKMEGEVEPGNLEEAYVLRDRGIVLWHLGSMKDAENCLRDAVHKFASFDDAAALAVTLHALSDVLLRNGKGKEARRYALAASALHPYGFISRGVQDHIKADQSGLRKDLDNLFIGDKPFDVVHQMATRLGHQSTDEPIDQNLRMVGIHYNSREHRNGVNAV